VHRGFRSHISRRALGATPANYGRRPVQGSACLRRGGGGASPSATRSNPASRQRRRVTAPVAVPRLVPCLPYLRARRRDLLHTMHSIVPASGSIDRPRRVARAAALYPSSAACPVIPCRRDDGYTNQLVAVFPMETVRQIDEFLYHGREHSPKSWPRQRERERAGPTRPGGAVVCSDHREGGRQMKPRPPRTGGLRGVFRRSAARRPCT